MADLHVMLLAGGSGTRFWPRSRADRPKQFLPLAGPRPMIDETWRRLRPLAPPRRLWVIAPERLAGDVRTHLPKLRKENLVLEPTPRDTAPAIALACEQLYRRKPDAIAAIFPTDHVIRDEVRFRNAVERAAKIAARGSLVCLGIHPDRPATGFGYLKCEKGSSRARVRRVERFVEKPTLARAKRFLKSGDYLWNAGMFVWRVDRFLEELERSAPEIREAVRRVVDGDRGAWETATRLSVDYAVMEDASDVNVVPLRAGWDDVGSWTAAAKLRRERGITEEQHILIDSPETTVLGESRTIAIVGAPGITVVDAGDAVLVIGPDRAEDVKEVVAELRRRGRTDLL